MMALAPMEVGPDENVTGFVCLFLVLYFVRYK